MFVSIISQVTPSESSVIKKVAYEPMFLSHLRDQLSIKGIRNVSLQEPLANVRPVIFLQFAPGAARTEVWRGLHGASTLRADCGKIVIAVSEDIDPTNTDAVFWSMAYRANPIEDVQIAPYRSGGHGPKSGRVPNDSTLLIDATPSSRCRRSRCRRANTWSARARSGTNSACRRSRRSRPGTATRSAIGRMTGKPSPSAPSKATGKRAARKHSRGAVAG